MAATVKKSSGNNRGEAAGLRWLAEAMESGGAKVAAVVAVDDSVLEIERIGSAAPSAEHARAFGRSLARTHAAGAPWWGCPPAGWVGPDHVGRSRTTLFPDPSEAPATFGELYGEWRVRDFNRRLVDRGVITDEAAVFDAIADRLAHGDYTSDQPRLIGSGPARVHGDLWSGNVLYCGGPTGAALIDPMAHGGHAETDLAALSVFGFPHVDDVLEGYNEVSPLADGWRERTELHQLGMVIMHAHLFGGHYVRWALDIARRYL